MIGRGIGFPAVLRAPEGTEGASGSEAPSTVNNAARAAIADAAIERIERPASLSTADAVALLRGKKPVAPAQDSRPSSDAPDDTGSGEEPDVAPPDGETSDETEGDDNPAGEPPIDPPRSWNKADRELFATLPPETQKRLVELDRTRELEIRRGQNEVAERNKAADAERQAAEQARRQYEQAIPTALTILDAEIIRDFPDIRSQQDIQRLAQTNPGRWADLQARIQTRNGYVAEAAQIQQRTAAEQAQAFERYVAQESEAFLAKAPEFADPEKASKLQTEALGTLRDLGFNDQEIEAAWTHGQPMSLRDHRVQLALRDAMRWRRGQNGLKGTPAKTVQPVTKPGVSAARGEAAVSKLTEAKSKLARTGSVDAAVAALQAKRAIAERRRG